MQNWKDMLKSYNIEYRDVFPSPQLSHQLFVTRCSSKKSSIKQGMPKQFYVSNIISNFINFCEKSNFNYAILSDKYGIVYSDEIIENYDVHPSQVSQMMFKELGNIIKEKNQEKNITELYFYNTSPLMSRPYFKMLSNSGIKSFFLTHLKIKSQEQSLFDFDEE